MKIAVVVPVWKRPELTRLVLRSWFNWKSSEVQIDFVIVKSPRDNHWVHGLWNEYRRMSEAMLRSTIGVHTFIDDNRSVFPKVIIEDSPNNPLGAKFNAGIECSRHWWLTPDYVMVMGSDVLVRDTIFEAYRPHMEAGEPFIGVYDTYIYDVATSRAFYWPGYQNHRKGEVIGPGRLYSRELLDSIDWAPYPPELNRDLDGGADANLPKPVGIWAREHRMCSVKTADSITKLSGYLLSGAVEVPTAELYFEGVDFTGLQPEGV